MIIKKNIDLQQSNKIVFKQYDKKDHCRLNAFTVCSKRDAKAIIA